MIPGVLRTYQVVVVPDRVSPWGTNGKPCRPTMVGIAARVQNAAKRLLYSTCEELSLEEAESVILSG